MRRKNTECRKRRAGKKWKLKEAENWQIRRKNNNNLQLYFNVSCFQKRRWRTLKKEGANIQDIGFTWHYPKRKK